MLWFGPVSSVFDLLCFALLWGVYGADVPERQSLFQSGWFVLGMLTQLLAVHLVRSPQLPWSGRRPAPALVAAGLAVAAVAVFLPMGPLAPAFGFQPLPLSFFAWVTLLVAGYALLAGAMKRAWLRHHVWQ
jgi:Mg2+-importing ATPase